MFVINQLLLDIYGVSRVEAQLQDSGLGDNVVGNFHFMGQFSKREQGTF